MRTYAGKTIWKKNEKRQLINSYKRLLKIKPDLSKSDFARSRGINPATFRRWLKQEIHRKEMKRSGKAEKIQEIEE